MEYVIGIDIGTGSVKGIVVNKSGDVLIEESKEYDSYQDHKGYSEQNPEDWINGTKIILKKLIQKMPELKEELLGISFSGQMHSLVLLDEHDHPLRRAILWNDVRTTKECQEITKKIGNKLLEKTKNIALEGFTLPKILWVKENEKKIWEKVNCLLLPKDYVSFYLTGNKQMEFSDAAGTLLLNVVDKKWDIDIANEFDIDLKLLPKLVSSLDCVGEIREALSKELGFTHPVYVFAGGADNACAALGAGITREDRGMCSIGTSGVFLSYEGVEERNYDGKLHFFNHTIPDSYYSMGVTLSAGQSLNWFKQVFAREYTFEELLKGAEKSPIGSRGLIFTPYIMGERTPHVDSKVRGSFIGIDMTQTFNDFTRSVIEGITFSLKESQVMLESFSGRNFLEIISVGGGAKSDFWLQIQANIFNAKIRTLKTEQGPGFGAAMIAAVGIGWFESIETCAEEFVRYEKEFLPEKKIVDEYASVFSLYKKIYEKTKDLSVKVSKTKS